MDKNIDSLIIIKKIVVVLFLELTNTYRKIIVIEKLKSNLYSVCTSFTLLKAQNTNIKL